MGLSTRLIIAKGSLGGYPRDFIEEMGFESPQKIGEKGFLSFRNLPENQIAIGENNGLVFICHHELPMYLIENEMSRRDYYKAYQKLNDTFGDSRYIAAIFQSSINGFGYGIYEQGEPVRQIMGDYEALMFNSGTIQEEEQMIKDHPDASNTKAMHSGKEYDLHNIGTELTEQVLNNFCEREFSMEDLMMTLFAVKQ